MSNRSLTKPPVSIPLEMRGKTGGLIAACVPLAEAFTHTRWTTIVDHINANRIGPAIETFIDRAEGGPAILVAVMFLVSFIVLAWPPRRRIVLPPTAPAEELE